LLASLYNVPSDQNGFMELSFANVDEHRKIITAVKNAYGIAIQEYIIDPIPLFDFPAWAYRHQQMHNQQNAVLGIAGNDLTAVDLTKPDELASWVNLHAQEHYQAASILGIS
jgi:hypothetical protein